MARSLLMAVDHRVATAEGEKITVRARSLCLHGDTPGAAALALLVREALAADGVALEPFA